MAAQSHLQEAQCLMLIQNISDALMTDATETVAAAIVEDVREAFGVSRCAIHEIVSRPRSLRCTYESLGASVKSRGINETVTYDEADWQTVKKFFAGGYFLYRADDEQRIPHIIANIQEKPQSMLLIPMYYGSDFLGVLELLDYERFLELDAREIGVLRVCANMLCQYLYRLNMSFLELHTPNGIDPVTGLMDFRNFTETLDRQFIEMLQVAPIAVVNTDIHHFKYINETYGYKKGDELLKLFANALTKEAEGVEVLICRAHADNFITAATVPRELVATFPDYIARQNLLLSQLLQDNCPNVRVRVVTGIAFVFDPGCSAATAIANANLARKVAKRENIRKPVIFTDEMMDEIKYQEYLNNELPKAIANHDLKVYYQPKINCADDTLYGAEALVRWQKPDGTFIYPDQFIPVFEKNGNIMEVDFYVYREVMRYLRGRMDAGLPVFPISMNVSRVHFRSDRIIPYIEGLLEEYQIPSDLVEFELTENIYMHNFSKANEFITRCRSRGIQVSMDDFGSGYSSLNVISALNIDTLKIDKIFLKDDVLSENDKTVIESMIAMAKRLGMKVICEGVETESQTLFLKHAHCDQIQGYYYGKPMDEESFNAFVAKLLGT